MEKEVVDGHGRPVALDQAVGLDHRSTANGRGEVTQWSSGTRSVAVTAPVRDDRWCAGREVFGGVEGQTLILVLLLLLLPPKPAVTRQRDASAPGPSRRTGLAARRTPLDAPPPGSQGQLEQGAARVFSPPARAGTGAHHSIGHRCRRSPDPTRCRRTRLPLVLRSSGAGRSRMIAMNPCRMPTRPCSSTLRLRQAGSARASPAWRLRTSDRPLPAQIG